MTDTPERSSGRADFRRTIAITARNPNNALVGGFLPAARDLGLDVLLLTDCPEAFDGTAVHVVGCEVTDHRAIIATLSRLPAVDGVFSNSDHLQAQTALAADYLGLPGKDWRVTLRCKNKALMRNHLAGRGLDVVRVAEVGPGEETALPQGASFPVILKPREGIASEDVTLVNDSDELRTACDEIRRRRPGDVLLVEEYLQGRLYTLETLGDGTTLHVLGGFATTLAPGEGFIEERLDFPAALPNEVVDQVLLQLRAIGVGLGACHTEFVVDEGGRARLIEVNYRVIGDDNDFALAELTGLPLFAVILQLHMGSPLHSLLSSAPVLENRFARVDAVIASKSGRLIAAPEAVEMSIDGVDLVYRPNHTAGDDITISHSNRDYLGIVRAVGTDERAVRDAVAAFRQAHSWNVT